MNEVNILNGKPKRILFCNSVLKLTFPLLGYYSMYTAHKVIHFHHHTTFEVLPPLMILTHSWTQDFFRSAAGTWRAYSCLNCSFCAKSALLYFAVFTFFKCSCSLTDSIVTHFKLTEMQSSWEFFSKNVWSSIALFIIRFLEFRAAYILWQFSLQQTCRSRVP